MTFLIVFLQSLLDLRLELLCLFLARSVEVIRALSRICCDDEEGGTGAGGVGPEFDGGVLWRGRPVTFR